jgi:hypothetical protein
MGTEEAVTGGRKATVTQVIAAIEAKEEEVLSPEPEVVGSHQSADASLVQQEAAVGSIIDRDTAAMNRALAKADYVANLEEGVAGQYGHASGDIGIDYQSALDEGPISRGNVVRHEIGHQMNDHGAAMKEGDSAAVSGGEHIVQIGDAPEGAFTQVDIIEASNTIETRTEEGSAYTPITSRLRSAVASSEVTMAQVHDAVNTHDLTKIDFVSSEMNKRRKDVEKAIAAGTTSVDSIEIEEYASAEAVQESMRDGEQDVPVEEAVIQFPGQEERREHRSAA